jgi:hypothetical protein
LAYIVLGGFLAALIVALAAWRAANRRSPGAEMRAFERARRALRPGSGSQRNQRGAG